MSIGVYVLAGVHGATRSARTRRRSSTSCSARSRPASCSTASRSSTARPARPPRPDRRGAIAGDRRDSRAAAGGHRPADRRLRLQGRARCRSTCGRPTSTKARRRRSPRSWRSASRRRRSPRSRASSCTASRGTARRLAMLLVGGWRSLTMTRRQPARDRADEHQAHARLLEHRARRLPARRDRRRRRRAAASAVLFYLLAYAFMNLGAFAVVDRARRGGRARTRSSSDYAGLGFRRPLLGVAMALFMLSLDRHPAARRLRRQALPLQRRRCGGLVRPRRDRRPEQRVSAAYYVRVLIAMYLTPGAEESRPHRAPAVSPDVDRAVAVLTVSSGSSPRSGCSSRAWDFLSL